ncbi:MAG: hypothetical protein WCV59_02550 [Parcubacteria group bacterium]|jgi:hypothetical protein
MFSKRDEKHTVFTRLILFLWLADDIISIKMMWRVSANLPNFQKARRLKFYHNDDSQDVLLSGWQTIDRVF